MAEIIHEDSEISEQDSEQILEQQWSLDDIEQYLERRLVQVKTQYQKNKDIKAYLDSFSTLLDQLYTDEGRATAVFLVQQKQESISQEYIDKALQTYKTTKQFDKVAQLAKNTGIGDQLLESYEHRGNWEYAAALARHCGLEDKAQALYKQAIIRHVKAGLLDDAGRLAQEAGLQEKAQEIFTIARKKEKPIGQKKIEFYEWFIQRKDVVDISSIADSVIDVLEVTGRFEKAAEVAEKYNLLHKALENWERAGQWTSAGAVAEQALVVEKEFCNKEQYALLFEKAITLYCKAGWIDHAAKLAIQEGRKEKAIYIYEEAHQTNKAVSLAKEIGLQQLLIVYEKGGWYQDAIQAIKNTEFAKRESLYKALLTLSTSSIECSLPDLPFVPQGEKENKHKKEEIVEREEALSEEEQIAQILPHLEVKPFPLFHGKLIELPPVEEDPYLAPYVHATSYNSSPIYSSLSPRQEDPSAWFLSRVGVNVVSSLTADTIKKYLPVFLTILGVSGGSFYTAYHGHSNDDREKSPAAVSLSPNANCPSKETLEGKFCRAYQWDIALRTAEQRYGLPAGLLAGLAMGESYGNPLELNTQNDGSAGMFQLEPEIAKKYGLVVYDERHAKPGAISYGKELQELQKKNDYRLEALERYDDRFAVEKSADVVAHYLHDLHAAFKKQQQKDKHLASHETLTLAVAAYKVGKDQAHAAVHSRDGYFLKIKEYQEYYLKRKKE